ncbi:hypothetical protein HYH02_001380 [Chlamydomonas schloesseri]|uniref:F-box domain-containing protein n=1 Tax=Chlamydomonas schloesseri TaxID=2026947 RepID=A0A836BD61_9CHLO|nr:hypothetical protein HYH02_001380 [Chlamydomonas schloesseri]|eukprot:KAG2454355.1 hypothetical protein HYH02_001380 [Chlamydomonas schloesseri]
MAQSSLVHSIAVEDVADAVPTAVPRGILDLPDDVLAAVLLRLDGVSLLRLTLASHAAAARLLVLPHLWLAAARAVLLPSGAEGASFPSSNPPQQALSLQRSDSGVGADSGAQTAGLKGTAAEAAAGAAGAEALRQALLTHARFSAWCHAHSLRLTRLAAALPPAVSQGAPEARVGGSSRGAAGGGAGPVWNWQPPSSHGAGLLLALGSGGGIASELGSGLAGAWKLSMADLFCLRVCSGSDIRVPYDERRGLDGASDGSCGGGGSGGSSRLAAFGPRRGQLCVQCFSAQTSPSGAPAKLCAVLLLQPETTTSNDGGGGSSSGGRGLRPVAWAYFRSAPPTRAAWWWFHPLGTPLVGGWSTTGLAAGADGFCGGGAQSACPVTAGTEPVVELWLARTGMAAAARDAGHPTSGPSARRGDRAHQPAGSRAVAASSSAAAASASAAAAASPAVVAAVAGGLRRLVAAGRERWRCVSSLAVVSRQQLLYAAPAPAVCTGARVVGPAPGAGATAGTDTDDAGSTPPAGGGHRAAKPPGQLRALSAAGVAVLDLTAGPSLSPGDRGGGGDGRDEETVEAVSARLRGQVAALPRTHPRLQVLLLPALLPRAPRAAVRKAPTRSGGTRTTAPRLLQLMVPVLSELRLAMAAPRQPAWDYADTALAPPRPRDVPPSPHQSRRPQHLQHLQHTLLVIGPEAAGPRQDQGGEARGGGGRSSSIGAGTGSVEAAASMASVEAVLRQLAASTLDRSTGSAQVADEVSDDD